MQLRRCTGSPSKRDSDPIGIPNVLFVWLLIGVILVFILRRTPFGRYIYAFGNRESATYLSGVSTRAVLIACFGLCSTLAALGRRAAGRLFHQGLSGDGRSLSAAGHRRRRARRHQYPRRPRQYLGTVGGVILITLLQSILSVMQMEEAYRQMIYGFVIISMLLVYGRSARVQS